MLARAETGVTTQALNDAAAPHGLFYPPDPGSHTVSTIGGNVATCAGGLRGLKYGVTRNYVLGLTVVLPTGEIVRTGGRLWKDVAGYDLTRLITGSEGTLGVITEVTVALLPNPVDQPHRPGLLRLADPGRPRGRRHPRGRRASRPRWSSSTASCMDAVEQYAHLGLHSDAGALLLFGDDGDEAVVARSFERIAAACVESGALTIQTAGDITESEALLTARRCTLPALSRLGSLTILEDASVPRPRLAEMVARIDAIAAQHQVTIGDFRARRRRQPASDLRAGIRRGHRAGSPAPSALSPTSSIPPSSLAGRSPASMEWARPSCPTWSSASEPGRWT